MYLRAWEKGVAAAAADRFGALIGQPSQAVPLQDETEIVTAGGVHLTASGDASGARLVDR